MTTALIAVALVAQLGSVREVRFFGADHMSTRELRELAGARPGDRMAPRQNERGRQAILRKYQEDGRYFASVELVEGGRPFDARVVYRVTEGPVVKVAEVRFRGNTTAGAADLFAAKRKGGAVTGVRFCPSVLDEDVKTVVGYYAGLGLAGTEVRPEVVRTAELGRVVIVYHITEARK